MKRASDDSRYFFSMPDNAPPSEEDGGILLRDDIAAGQEAAQILTELARDVFPMEAGAIEISLQVSDQRHRPIFRVRMHLTIEDLRRH